VRVTRCRLKAASPAGFEDAVLDKMEKELTKLGCGGVSVVTKVAPSKRKIITVTGCIRSRALPSPAGADCGRSRSRCCGRALWPPVREGVAFARPPWPTPGRTSYPCVVAERITDRSKKSRCPE